MTATAFSLFPAIDLRSGECVRLRQGEMSAATVYSSDPLQQAKRFAAAGARLLHVVDLDGAVGIGANRETVGDIVRSTPLQVQLGGGIRNEQTIESWLDAGVCRVVLGTLAVTHTQVAVNAIKRWPGKIAIGLDCRDGDVAIRGWVEQTQCSAQQLLSRFADLPVAAFIITDIARDGMMTGPNLQLLSELAAACSAPIIASGGVRGIDDLVSLSRLRGIRAGGRGDKELPLIAGAIVGRAFYDGSADLAASLAAVRR